MVATNTSTAADGTASTSWTLGKLAGPQTVVATADGAPPLTVDTTAIAGPPASVAMSAARLKLEIGEKLPLSVRILDANGNVVPGTPAFTFTTTPPDVVSVSPDATVTGVSQGNVNVQAAAGGLSASLSLTVSGLLSGKGTATVDGQLSPGEWDGATSTPISVVVDGGTTPGHLLVMNDGTNFYAAIAFARAAADFASSVALEFDADGSGTVSVGDDFIILNPGVGFGDGVRSTAPPCPSNALCAPLDTDVGGSNDGAGAFQNDGRMSVYELRHPLNSGDPHDFSLHSGSVIGMNLFIRVIPNNTAGIFDTNFPALLGSSPSSYLQVTIQ